MTRALVILGVTALLFVFVAGCNDSSSIPDPMSDDTLTEIKVGDNVFDPVGMNIIAFSQENRMTFSFSKKFHPKTFKDSISAKILVNNRTQGWTNEITTADLFSNGSVTLLEGEDGSDVLYSATHTLDYMLMPTGNGGYGDPSYYIAPGDELLIKVSHLTARYEDDTPFMLWGDNYSAYCAREQYERPVYPDDLDTEGFIESIKMGPTTLDDEDINLIILSEISDISLDFATQLNPNTFAAIVNFKIVVNNLSQNKSFVFGREEMLNNGSIYMIDYVRGMVKYQMTHTMGYLVDGYVIYGTEEDLYTHLGAAVYNSDERYYWTVEDPLVEPGDLVEVQIDFFQGEDILENQFLFEQKKFRIFVLGS